MSTYGSTPTVHRSVRRWLSDLLDEDWTVHLENRFRSDKDAARPVAWVEVPLPTRTRFARVGYGEIQGDVEREATFVAVLLPVSGELPQQSTVLAQDLAEALQVAVEVGVIGQDGIRRVSKPGQFPLYLYDDVPVTGRNRAGPEDPYGHADVLDVSARAIPDPDDDLAYAVVLNLRLRWWSSGALEVGPLATSIPSTFHRSGDITDDEGSDFPDGDPDYPPD